MVELTENLASWTNSLIDLSRNFLVDNIKHTFRCKREQKEYHEFKKNAYNRVDLG